MSEPTTTAAPAVQASNDRIAFFGGGNMARSLIGGLVHAGTPASAIRVVEPHAAVGRRLEQDFGVSAFESASTGIADADTWLLAVKPQVVAEVCAQLAPLAQARRPLLVSIAAGITTAQLGRWLGGELPVVRAMPNTPALLGAGVIGLFANAAVDAGDRERAERILSGAGTTVWIEDEALMDAVTATSGSGPAYVFLLAEAIEQAAIAEGLPPETARTLTLQTVLGAARMLTESGETPAELRRRVTSPNGTTHAAIDVLETGGFRTLVGRAIAAATRRGAELSAAYD